MSCGEKLSKPSCTYTTSDVAEPHDTNKSLNQVWDGAPWNCNMVHRHCRTGSEAQSESEIQEWPAAYY